MYYFGYKVLGADECFFIEESNSHSTPESARKTWLFRMYETGYDNPEVVQVVVLVKEGAFFEEITTKV
jgi:hypothetical protein